MTSKKAKAKKPVEYRELRAKKGLTQAEFWNAIGCTQSAGSRYESGRAVPKPTRALIHIVHVEGRDVSKLLAS